MFIYSKRCFILILVLFLFCKNIFCSYFIHLNAKFFFQASITIHLWWDFSKYFSLTFALSLPLWEGKIYSFSSLYNSWYNVWCGLNMNWLLHWYIFITTIIHVNFLNSVFIKPIIKMSAHSIELEYIKD